MHNNFAIYTPEDPQLKKLQDEFGIVFMQDDKGNDWYDLHKQLDEKLITVFCNKDGEVISASKDFTAIPPIAGGFCFQVEDYPYLDTPGKVVYNKKTKKFKQVAAKKPMGTLLKELKILEIKAELGDEDVSDKILEKKREIMDLASEE